MTESDPFSKQLLKLSIARLMRVATYLSLQAQDVETIFNFKYPLFSYICFIIVTYVAIMMDISTLIPDLILLTVILFIYNHPKIKDFVQHYFNSWFFNPVHRNPHYLEPRVQTLDDLENKKLMNTERWRYKLVDNESLMSLMKRAKKSIVILTIKLTKIAGFIEKLKNIAIWQDPIKTLMFIGFCLVAYCVLSVLNFRFLVLLGIWGKFGKGIKYYENLYKKNKEYAEIALRLTIKEHYPNYFPQIYSNMNKPWPEIASSSAFQEKIVEKMRYRLNVNLPEDVLLISRTPMELISRLTTCGTPLKLKMLPEEANNLRLFKKKNPTFKMKNLLYFIMNVPSDYYREIHPKTLDIKANNKQKTN